MSEMIIGRHLPPITSGHQIYCGNTQFAGVTHHKRDATRFVCGRDQWIEFERDPNNRHDPNAIKIVGHWRGWFRKKRALVGYVPRDLARLIAETNVFDVIEPRLVKTFMGRTGFVDIEFQFTGPKDGVKAFKDAVRESWEKQPVPSCYPPQHAQRHVPGSPEPE